MGSEFRKPDVSEAYVNCEPPKGTAKLVVSLLENVPSRLYVGLAQICLLDASGLSKARRRLKTTQKARVGETLAVYSPPNIREPARIEIFVDKVLSQLPSIFRRVEFFRELVIAQVLLHELGHHVQAQRKVRLRRIKEEAFAEAIAAKLLRRLVNRKYKFLKPLIAIFNMGLDVRDKFMDSPKK